MPARPPPLSPPLPPEDPEHKAQALQIAIYRAMTPAQRLAQAQRLRESMLHLLAAGFRDRHPDWSDLQIRRAVADRVLHARTG